MYFDVALLREEFLNFFVAFPDDGCDGSIVDASLPNLIVKNRYMWGPM